METSISTESTILLAVFGAAFVISSIMTWFYAERSINLCAFLTASLGITIGLCTIPLVPYDVWAAQVQTDLEHRGLDKNSVTLPISPSAVQHCWEGLYWLTFVLCYFFIPLIMEFESAGDFRFTARLKTSLRRNCIWYVAYLFLGILLLIFLPDSWRNADGQKQGKLMSFSGFCIAASNTFGLLILTLLMGSGLVGLPRHLWVASDISGNLKNLYTEVTAQNITRLAATSELQEVIEDVGKEIEAVESRMAEMDERHTSGHKAPLCRAVRLLQKSLASSEEFHGKLVEMSSPDSPRSPNPRSRSGNVRSSSPNTHSNFNPRNLLGFWSTSSSSRNVDPLQSRSDSVEGRRKEIRERRQDLESHRLTGLLGEETEATRHSSSDFEAQRLSESSGLDRHSTGAARNSMLTQRNAADLLADMQHLTKKHSALKFVTLEARRAKHQWDFLVQRCSLIEDIQNLEPESLTDSSGTQWSERRQLYETSWTFTRGSLFCCCGCCRKLLRNHYKVRQCWRQSVLFWYNACRPRLLKFLSCCAGMLSFLIVLGQLTMFSSSLSFFSVFGVLVHHVTNCSFIGTHVVCLVPLTYMAATSCWTIFRLRISGWYGLYPNHSTDSTSLLWCAMAVTRISVALCYHFLGLLHITEKTAFEDFMQPMEIVPVLGKDFNSYFPLFIVLLCACNVAGVYSGIVRRLGLNMLDTLFDRENGQEEEGKELVAMERRRRFEHGVTELQRNSDEPEAVSALTQNADSDQSSNGTN